MDYDFIQEWGDSYNAQTPFDFTRKTDKDFKRTTLESPPKSDFEINSRPPSPEEPQPVLDDDLATVPSLNFPINKDLDEFFD